MRYGGIYLKILRKFVFSGPFALVAFLSPASHPLITLPLYLSDLKKKHPTSYHGHYALSVCTTPTLVVGQKSDRPTDGQVTVTKLTVSYSELSSLPFISRIFLVSPFPSILLDSLPFLA